MTLFSLRRSALALFLAVTAWATGCAITPRPVVDPGYAARAYTPLRVAVLPPDVFVVVDQVGDNDPAQAAALGQQVSGEIVQSAEQVLRARGYDVDLSARWDGIHGQDGAVLVSGEELGGLANGVLAFANSQEAASEGALATPRVVAPELASHVGWATQSDAVLYLNVKGAVTTPGKRTASILIGVFFVAIVAAVVIALVASSKGGGNSGGSNGFRGSAPGTSAVGRAPAGGWRGTPTTALAPRGGTPIATPRGAPIYRGGGAAPSRAVGAPVYVGGPHVGVGVGVIVPLDGPVYTHDGRVDYDEPMFAGDQLYVSMTLVSTYDGRVLWHARDSVDLEADHPEHIDELMHAFLETLPPALPRATATNP
ncbi:MAG TPA: hypothetical protein VN903_38155 [Polyangia bacterium]|nr:hypothetical protein [Polyangia bacterium]